MKYAHAATMATFAHHLGTNVVREVPVLRVVPMKLVVTLLVERDVAPWVHRVRNAAVSDLWLYVAMVFRTTKVKVVLVVLPVVHIVVKMVISAVLMVAALNVAPMNPFVTLLVERDVAQWVHHVQNAVALDLWLYVAMVFRMTKVKVVLVVLLAVHIVVMMVISAATMVPALQNVKVTLLLPQRNQLRHQKFVFVMVFVPDVSGFAHLPKIQGVVMSVVAARENTTLADIGNTIILCLCVCVCDDGVMLCSKCHCSRNLRTLDFFFGNHSFTTK
jgi:hypothetical protein